jgi:hypothetical protein
MKKLLFIMLMAIVTTAKTMAYDYPYLVFVKSDNSIVAVSTTDITLAVTGSTITVDGTEYTISNLSKCYFTKEVPSGTIQVTIPSIGWVTFCSTNALDYSNVSGITAYKATFDTLGGKVTKSEIGVAVPASTGVILQGEEGTYDIPVVSIANAVSGNELLGATTEISTASGSYYALTKLSESAVGFKLVQNGTSIPAGKAYYYADASQARVTYFVLSGEYNEEETNGVGEVRSEKEEVRGNVYDLQGRRIANPAKGVYIKNGKKIIIK